MEDHECLVRLSNSPRKVPEHPKESHADANAVTKLIDDSLPDYTALSASTLQVMQMLDDWQESTASASSRNSPSQAIREEAEISQSLPPNTPNPVSPLQNRPPTYSAGIGRPLADTTNQLVSLPKVAEEDISSILKTASPVPTYLPFSAPSTNTIVMSIPSSANMKASIPASISTAMDISLPSELEHSSLSVNRDALPDGPSILRKSMSVEGEMDIEAIRPVFSATTLATRTTGDVIADLKRLRPIPEQDSSKRQRSTVSVAGTPKLSKDDISGLENDSPDQESSDEEEDEAGPATKARKISERKRLLKATVDTYILDRTLKQIKEGTVVRPEDEANQSARWLVNQSEDRQIISTPREYQTELFEKAKEKNIIAVLDTGM